MVAASAWQPIETAPKDGTIILIVDMGTAHPRVEAGFWGPKHGDDPDFPWVFLDSSVRSGLNGWMDGHLGPTHWMPLPEAPKP